MTGLDALWLPILLSSVVVFVASSLIHMVLPWHRTDYRKLPRQDEVMSSLRPFAIPPGDYMVPCPTTRDEMRSPEFREKMKQGPVLVTTVLPSDAMNMGRNFALWLLYLLVVGVLAAYIAGRALPPGASYRQVFRFAGATAFIAHSAALWPFSIWYRRAWTTTLKATVDGLIYGLLTAGVFGWLWPHS